MPQSTRLHPIAPRGAPALPELIWFLARHMAFGLLMGVFFATLLIAMDVAGLRRLITSTSEPHVALVLLYAFNAITFASVAMGIAVMTLPFDKACDMRDPEWPQDHSG